MKAKQILWSVVAAFAALGLASCDGKEKDDPTGGLALNKAKYEMSVGDEYQLKATVAGAEVVAEWSTSDAAVASVEAGLIKGLKEGSATITATFNGESATCAVTVVAIAEDMPALEAPGAGKVTICVQAPKAMCGYLVAPGTLTDWNPGDGANKALSLVDGTTTWYAGTFDWEDGVKYTFKIAATDADGVWSWDYQLANGELLEGDCSAELTSDITINKDNQVIYISVTEFSVDPCGELAPAGLATFNLTATGFPEGTEFGIAGNFAEKERAWACPPAPENTLTLKDGVYTGQIEVPAVFTYKYLVKLPDADWAWWTPNPNLIMPTNLITNDTTEYVAPEEPEEAPAE